ncbi:MAG: hypothetical protein QOC68_3462 [Solirubrobacteraceae bacterium]|nr:hypothetical protein [Solirubrobacteraceae bacterium]
MVLSKLAGARRWWMVLLAAVVLIGVPGAAGARAGDAAAAGHGKSFGEWHAAWWQWAFSFPFSAHPLNPDSGASCATGQTGHVWFLGGVFNATGTVTRDCVVPSGTALVVAVADVECSTVESPPFSGTDPASLRACAAGVVDPASPLFVTDAFARLDGRSLRVSRVPSPVFSFSASGAPGDSILTCPCSGTSGLAVADGYMLFLHPLAVGRHTLHFGGSFPAFPYTLDITYRLTVAPRGHAS